MNGVVLVSGIPGAGKTTVSRLLARRLPRAAHIESHIWSHLGESMRRGLGDSTLWLDNGAQSAEETAAEIERRLQAEAAIRVNRSARNRHTPAAARALPSSSPGGWGFGMGPRPGARSRPSLRDGYGCGRSSRP